MQTLEGLGHALEITLAAFCLIVIAMIIYLGWLLIALHREVERYYRLRPPEVARDANGRRIRERI